MTKRKTEKGNSNVRKRESFFFSLSLSLSGLPTWEQKIGLKLWWKGIQMQTSSKCLIGRKLYFLAFCFHSHLLEKNPDLICFFYWKFVLSWQLALLIFLNRENVKRKERVLQYGGGMTFSKAGMKPSGLNVKSGQLARFGDGAILK